MNFTERRSARPQLTPPRLLLLAALVAGVCALAQADTPPQFGGRLVLEMVDDVELDHKLRLMEDFTFRDAQGKLWLAPKHGVIDGTSLPRALRAVAELPPETEFRKASVIHDYYTRARQDSWRDVRRMLYSASLQEGLGPAEAKLLYAVVYAGGWRWEPRTSSCYRSCHAAAAMLAWQPDVTQAELQPVVDWLRNTDPSLAEIERRVDAVIPRPGPHLFVQVRQHR